MSRVRRAIAIGLFGALCATRAGAQSFSQPLAQQHQHAAAVNEEPNRQEIPLTREGSGTSWLPDATPMYAVHWRRGAWLLMAHGNAFLQFLHEPGDRGDDQFGSINWVMGMAQRNAGRGRLQLRAMFSAEPATIPGCGYPDLLASGEQCDGEPIHDRQHPHDLFMELAAVYSAPIARDLHWQVYAAAAGEPALGPVAYPHRVSAMPNPLAPISHHWLDSTHIAFGVVTGALYGTRWKAETSVFNGREPDQTRSNFDFAAMDSVSGRLWLLPSSQVALQISGGHLKEAEPGEAGAPRITVNRITASGTYHRGFRETGIWASTIAWGRNAEPGHSSNALLVETNVSPDQQNTWFGRFEAVGKSAHDLDVAGPPAALTVSKLQGGYTRYLRPWKGLQPGLGASISAGLVPETLEPVYGSRLNTGAAIFLTIRPAAMSSGEHAGHVGGSISAGLSRLLSTRSWR